MMPGKYCFNNCLRSSAVIGMRLVLRASSSAEGGGTFSNPYTQIINGIANTNPVKNGTQNSVI